MKNKFNNGRYSRDYISPTLEKLFLHFNKKQNIKNIKEYIEALVIFLKDQIRSCNNELRKLKESPLFLQREKLSSLDEVLYETLKVSIGIIEECRAYYPLTLHQETTLNDAEDNIRYASNNVYEVLLSVTEVYEGFKEIDYLAEEIYYQEDASEVLTLPTFFN